MKKNITLQANESNAMNIVNNIQMQLESSVEGIANMYSILLGETVTSRQTLHLLNAQFAFLGIVLPVGMPILFHAASVVWFALALRSCRRAGL